MNDVFVEVTLAPDSGMGVFPVDTWFQESRFYSHVDPNFLVGFLDYRGGVRAFSEDFGAHFFYHRDDFQRVITNIYSGYVGEGGGMLIIS